MNSMKLGFADFVASLGKDEWAASIIQGIEDIGAANFLGRDGKTKMNMGKDLVSGAFSTAQRRFHKQ